MTSPIQDITSLPGKKISDQAQTPIGEVKEIYATEDGFPVWAAVELSSGIGDKQRVFIPLARIKEEGGELQVPYSKQHIGDSPDVGEGDGLSAECDRRLRDFYGIDAGDQEMRSDNKSYATLVPDDVGPTQRVDDPGQLETPDADRTTDESRKRLHDPGSSEIRHVSAEDVTHDTQGDDDSGPSGDEDDKGQDENADDVDQEHERDEDSHGSEDQ